MQDYVIFTDTSADIDPRFAAENDIRFVPMHYTLGEEDLLLTGMESDDFLISYYRKQKTGLRTQTSQITPQTYVDLFTPILEEGKGVLYLSLSSGLTRTFDSACLARRILEEDCPDASYIPVDTLSGTGGMGLLAEAAVRGKKEGLSLEENAAVLEDLSHQVSHFFMVDDLMYLKRGGRIPASTAILGTALQVKPILVIEGEGKLITVNKKRGVRPAMKELAASYAAHRLPDLEKKYGNRIYIVHSAEDGREEILADLVRAVNPAADIHVMRLNPVIGAHTGPGMVAIIFFGSRVS